jgi:hypothetical protein
VNLVSRACIYNRGRRVSKRGQAQLPISYLPSAKQVHYAIKPIGDLVHFHKDLDKHAAPYFKKISKFNLKGSLL